MTESFGGKLLFDSEARYQVRVLGWINESWSDRLAGMAISQDATDGKIPESILEGELQDQAALVGVIIKLYEMHFPVLLVKCLTCQGTNAEEL